MTAKFDASLSGPEPVLLKDGEPVDPATLTEDEKVQAIKALLKRMDDDYWDRIGGAWDHDRD